MNDKDIDLVSFSKLGFSDINMTATYANGGLTVLVSCDNFTVKTCNILKPLGRLKKPL